MRSINKVLVMGRVGQTPQVRDAGQNKVASFSVATSKSWKKGDEWQEETQWHNVQAWGPVAERVTTGFSKGDIVLVEGEIRYRKYTDQNGVEKAVTDIHAFSVQMMEKYKPKDSAYAPATAAAPAAPVSRVEADPFAVPTGPLDDLPF